MTASPPPPPPPAEGNPTPIPIVDFGKFLHGGAEDQKKIALEIDDAFRTAGFVYLRGHGVDGDLVKECFEWSKKLFNLPEETKLLAPHPPGHTHHRGYSAPGREKVANLKKSPEEIAAEGERLDCKESYEIGNVTDTMQPNIWLPDHILPGFRPFMERYFDVCTSLVHRILDALSIALNVPPPGLSPTHSASLFQLRLLHYPSLPAHELQDNKRSRINAHADFGTITLLFQDSIGGLQVEHPHQPNHFTHAEPIRDTVLVNMGEMMTRWSNERWRSTVHRVGLPSKYVGEHGEAVVPDRYSIPFFATANMDQAIDALPSCWSEDNPKKFEPTTALDFLMMRMADLYSD